MKRLVFLAALTVLLVACGNSARLENAIIGGWANDSTTDAGDPYTQTWEFAQDATIIVTTNTTLFDISSSFTGTYEFEDEDTIALHQDDAPDAPPGRRDIRMPDDNTLILTAPVSGDILVFKRIQEP